MKKLVILILAILFIVPLFGCNGAAPDAGPVKVNGKSPDAKQEGSKAEPGGQSAQQAL